MYLFLVQLDLFLKETRVVFTARGGKYRLGHFVGLQKHTQADGQTLRAVCINRKLGKLRLAQTNDGRDDQKHLGAQRVLLHGRLVFEIVEPRDEI